MKYRYERYLSDLKDLKHIEWFVCHRDEYEFTSPESKLLLDELVQIISQKNIYYYIIYSKYEKLVSMFENDPFEYAFDLKDTINDKTVRSEKLFNYFVEIEDAEGKAYHVPFEYLMVCDEDSESNRKKYFDHVVEKRDEAVRKFKEIEEHYTEYWINGGVKNALNRYEDENNGKSFHLMKCSICFCIYNIALFIILHETQFFRLITHFWKLWYNDVNCIYSTVNVFEGHKILGTIAIVLVAYFLYMDFVYMYGIYHMRYIKFKYDSVMSYHSKVRELAASFYKDFNLCDEGIKTKIIPRSRNRESVYIPLIQKSNKRFNFTYEKTFSEGKKTYTRRYYEPLKVRVVGFYKRPILSGTIWIWILLIFVHSICNYTNMISF